MTSVELAYGRTGLVVDLPVEAEADTIEPQYLPGLTDEAATLGQALRQPIAGPPLRDVVPRGAMVGISVCDVTRPFPARRVLPVLLEELDYLDPAAITIFVATGTHRRCSDAELLQMFGPELLGQLQVQQHDAFDIGRHRSLGTIPETRVAAYVERDFLEQDVRITTGFIEPHFFAGFSGGPKMVAPGLAALETVLELHSAARIGHPRATWGITQGNPVHDGVRAIAELAGVSFNLDVTLNRDHAITNVFAGELFASHAAGCAFARATAMVRVEDPYDVVVTTNSGYPLDQNLYQSVKGMSAAAQIVKPGGTIVIASECSDGLPEHGGYQQLLRQADGPEAFLARLAQPGVATHDQWQVQVQALIQRRARVFVKATGLTAQQLRTAWFEPVDDVAAAVRAALTSAGPKATLAVLPQGPQTIPYVTRQ
ncbi:MAG TPA: nickel-dependent lactate racemase [Chloroflexota bacterium]|nr:nickel-dependent lactate racemase [Chloroflexota bacterium]